MEMEITERSNQSPENFLPEFSMTFSHLYAVHMEDNWFSEFLDKNYIFVGL